MTFRSPKPKQISLAWYVLGVLVGLGALYALGQFQHWAF